MAEVRSEATYVKHHKKKIALLFAAMRHFAHGVGTRGRLAVQLHKSTRTQIIRVACLVR